MEWTEAAKVLGIAIEAPYSVRLSSGIEISVDFCLPQFGYPNGMLVVSDYETIRHLTDQIVADGFGFSCLSRKNRQEAHSLDTFKAVLRDWSWNSETSPPRWYNE